MRDFIRSTLQEPNGHRLKLAAFGALAGGAFWALGEFGESLFAPQLLLFVVCWVAVFFGASLLLAGPLPLVRALPRAAGLAFLVAGLMLWGAQAYENVDDFLSQSPAIVCFLVLCTLPLPFMIARATEGRYAYAALFEAAWGIVLRAVAAQLFVLICWLVIWLSHLTLGLVRLDFLEQLWETPVLGHLLTGAVFGLGLAILHELRAWASPILVQRLLRLLVVPLVAVVLLFLLAAPLRGLSDLFGGLSASVVLLSMMALGASLITACVDRSNAEAASSGLLRLAAWGLALMLPILAGLVAWALWVRIAAYGLTPDRIAAAAVFSVALGYGVSYAIAVLRGAAWMRYIRRANKGLALWVMLLAALWLTPLIAPNAWSVQSQIARYEAGHLAATDLPLQEMRRAWGRAGAQGLERLATLAETKPDLAKALSSQKRPPSVISTDEILADMWEQEPLASLPPEAKMALQDPEHAKDLQRQCAARPDLSCTVLAWNPGDISGPETGVLIVPNALTRSQRLLILHPSAEGWTVGWVSLTRLGMADPDEAPAPATLLQRQMPVLRLDGQDFVLVPR